jgi:flagellin-like hook-associated protein FlgL
MNAEGTRFATFSQSNFIANGGGSWETLIGTNVIDLSVTSSPKGTKLPSGNTAPTDTETVYGNDPTAVSEEVANIIPVTPEQIEISGLPIGTEGYGTKDITDTSKNILDFWGVSSFEPLLASVAMMTAANAAQQNTLRHGLDTINARNVDLEALNGAITNTDLAHEVTTLAKTQLLNQSASSAFAQTNVSAESVVKALWGEISSGIDWYKPDVLTSILPKIAFE